MSKIFSKVAFNTSIQIIGKIISVSLSFVSIALLTRYLGATGYGKFTLVFTYVSFFSVIADFGLQSTMVREIAFNPNNKTLQSNLLSLKLILIIFSSLLASLILVFFPYQLELKVGILIAILAVAISGLTGYGTVIFQSRIRLDLVTYIDLITKIVTVGFIVLFVHLALNLYFIIATVLLGNLIGLGIAYLLLQDVISLKYDIAEIKRILILSFPIGLSTFLGLAYFKIDTIMLSLMRSSTEVGLYSLAYKILENVLLIWGYYMASIFPLMASFKGNDNYKKVQELLKNSMLVAFLLGIILWALGNVFASLAINIFGGQAYSASVLSLKILLISLPFLFINNLCSDFLIIHKANKVIFIGIATSVVFNIMCNLYVIPRYGFIGASYVTVASAMVQAVYYVTQMLSFKKEKYEK